MKNQFHYILLFIVVFSSTVMVVYSLKEGFDNTKLMPEELGSVSPIQSFFKDTEFRPECCPSAYSTSTGCPCVTEEQNVQFNERFGNNNPYSIY